MNRTTAVTVFVSLVCAAPLTAQDKDMRDVVTLESGKDVRGRIARDFDPDELLVMQGGKRVRIDRDRVKAVDSVRARVFEFLDARMNAKDNARFHWSLAEWATSKQLDSLARLQALTVIELDDTHQAAHEFLGHRQHKTKGWLWPERSRWLTREQLDEYHADIGHPLVLESEHFRIRTDGGIRRAVAALIDLERMYRFWFETWGQRLGLQECLDPMEIQVWNDAEEFSGWTSFPTAYFVPNPYADRSYTFYKVGEDRPADLFAVGTQHLLYACLARDSDTGGQQERFCDWLEIGLGQWLQNRMRGDIGRAEVKPHQFEQWEADFALASRRRDGRTRHLTLDNLLHWTVRDHFYGTIYNSTEERSVYWASAHLFTAFLMDESVDKDVPGRLIDFLRVALGEGKGDSSSVFDRAMQQDVERFGKPFEQWLVERASPSVGR